MAAGWQGPAAARRRLPVLCLLEIGARDDGSGSLCRSSCAHQGNVRPRSASTIVARSSDGSTAKTFVQERRMSACCRAQREDERRPRNSDSSVRSGLRTTLHGGKIANGDMGAAGSSDWRLCRSRMVPELDFQRHPRAVRPHLCRPGLEVGASAVGCLVRPCGERGGSDRERSDLANQQLDELALGSPAAERAGSLVNAFGRMGVGRASEISPT